MIETSQRKNVIEKIFIEKMLTEYESQIELWNQVPSLCNGVAWSLFDEVMRLYLNFHTYNVNQN